jgi:hypothetical protein
VAREADLKQRSVGLITTSLSIGPRFQRRAVVCTKQYTMAGWMLTRGAEIGESFQRRHREYLSKHNKVRGNKRSDYLQQQIIGT